MKKFRFTIVLSILILCWSLFASEVEDEYISNSSSYEIKFEPISATENVDLYTGVFTAKVNLMELLGQNDLSFPVTLTYNSDLNHKDKDNYQRQASQCGLGWKLELPVITASTLSYEKYSGTGLTQPISGSSITSSHIRPIYNQFIYSSPSGGGELVFHASNTSCDSFYIRDYKPWKIICDYDNYKWEIDSWKVIDEHGTTYTFNHKRKRIWRMYINDILGSCTSECSLLEYLYNTQDDMLINHYIIGYQWDLTEIKDVFGNEIEIQYLSDVEENVRDRYRDGVTCPEMPYDSLSHDYEYTRSSYINKIVSTGTGREIRFYWEDRSDDDCRWDDAWTGSIPRSSCFTDWETNGDEYQEIFDSKRLAALKLVNTNSGNQVLKHVGFDYSESTFDWSLDVVRSLLTKIVQYDPSDTVQSLPALKFEYDMSDSANANVGALYRITYPDGGTKQIAFNQTNPSTIVSGYHYVDTFQNDKYRVASITTNDKMGNSSVKTYTWSSTQSDTCDYLYTYGHDHVIVSLPDNKGKIKYNHITNAATNKHGLISSILYYQSDSTNYDKKISKTWTVTHMETDTVPKVSGADYIRNSYMKTLTEETTVLDGVSSTVAFSYNDFGMVSKTTATNTDGNKKITKIKYGWQDYSLLEGTNQLSDITGETVYLDTVLTSNLKSDFSMTMYLWGYDMAPKNYRRWDGSAWVSQSDIITRNTDFGNILETEDGNDMRTTTRWDSSGLPIATVQNAEHEECSYLNFEGGDLLDGWSKTASASITSDMYFTGSASFSAANGYWALANDWYDEGSNEDREYDSNKKYKVSVWVYLTNAADIGQTILGIGSHPTGYGADYGSATKAKQWELVTAECDAGSILNDEVMRVWIAAKYCSGTVYFDDLRVYPSDAIMETTVYEPCTGTVLAKADPNNMPVIYDYDPYLRLVRTRNADGKLLTSTQHYYSRDVRENFLNTDPNYYRTITLTSANGYSNFAGSDGWTTSGSV
ncbi:hypothetical protein GF406_01070, partial [candidate division KSB1 bacterium]|nr:hypothetical protein [candidate division KSB1 bacterium]